MSDLINNQSEIYLQQPVVSNSQASGNSYVATGPEYIIHKPLFDDTAANKRAWSLYREFNPIDNQKMDKKLKQLDDDIFVTEKHHMPDIPIFLQYAYHNQLLYWNDIYLHICTQCYCQ